jgi:hypothetical protein
MDSVVEHRTAKKLPPTIYRGVSFHQQKTSERGGHPWSAQLWLGKKQKHLGYFKTDEAAARAYDFAAAQLPGKSLNFPGEALVGHVPAQNIVGVSKFVGTSWHSEGGRWRAQCKENGKNRHLGLFKSEEAAARKYDDTAGPLGMPVNFPKPGQKQAIKGAPAERSSRSADKMPSKKQRFERYSSWELFICGVKRQLIYFRFVSCVAQSFKRARSNIRFALGSRCVQYSSLASWCDDGTSAKSRSLVAEWPFERGG